MALLPSRLPLDTPLPDSLSYGHDQAGHRQTPLPRVPGQRRVPPGFRFVGPAIRYAFMQARGPVNGHLVGRSRYKQRVPAMTGRTARRRA